MGIDQRPRVEAEAHHLQPGRLPGTQEGHGIHSCCLCLDGDGRRETRIDERRAAGGISSRDRSTWQTSASGDRTRFVHPEFSFINDCAYFDYQRERVFVRTSKTLRKRKKPRKGAHRNRTLRKSKDYVIVNTNCPSCNSGDLVVASAARTESSEPGIRGHSTWS